MSNWLILIMAGMLEVLWALGMKYSDGLTKPVPSAATIALIVLSLYLLNLSLRTLPVGTAYAVWTGIGIIGTSAMGIVLFDEPASIVRLGCILLIVIGIIGLRLLSDA